MNRQRAAASAAFFAFALALCATCPVPAADAPTPDLTTLFPWEGFERDGVRLHVVPGTMDHATVERLLRERAIALSSLKRTYQLVPPKAVDVFLAPAGRGLSGVHLLPSTWTVAAVWDGEGSTEDRCPARSLTRLFVAVLAGPPRVAHPFVAEGLARGAEGRAAQDHELFVGRRLADGVTDAPSVSGADLACSNDRSRLAAASFLHFLAAQVGMGRLTGLARGTNGLTWDPSSLGSRWLTAVTNLSGSSPSDLQAAWGRFLEGVVEPFTLTAPWEAPVRAVLVREGELLKRLLPYRDEPYLGFVAETASGQRYLVEIRRGTPVLVSRWRSKPPRLVPDRPQLSAGVSAADAVAARRLVAERLAAASDASGLAKVMVRQGVDAGRADEPAARLALHCESARVMRVERVVRVVTQYDLGPTQGSVEAVTVLRTGRTGSVVLDETWRELRTSPLSAGGTSAP